MFSEDNLLLKHADAKIELVYSSRMMNKEFEDRLGQPSATLLSNGYSVNVYFTECPSTSEE